MIASAVSSRGGLHDFLRAGAERLFFHASHRIDYSARDPRLR